MTIGGAPSWPSPRALTAPPAANTLYNKFRVILEPVNSLTADSTGAQIETFGTARALTCNVQISGNEGVEPGVYQPVAGLIFAAGEGSFKARDRVTHLGRLFRIQGVKKIYENIPPYQFHHLEGSLVALESTVQ